MSPRSPSNNEGKLAETRATDSRNGDHDARRKRNLARIDPASLRFFIAAIEEGTIAAAAKREHVVAAAVSKRITRLEDTLRTQLVTRTNKGLKPTAAGGALLSLARHVLLDLEELYVQMHEYSSGIRGHVKVAANVSAITQYLPAEIKTFITNHPQIQIEVEERSSTDIARAVAENVVHIGILTMGAPHGQELETFPYHSHELVLVTPNQHPLAARTSVSFAETLPYEYVGLHSGSAMSFQLLNAAAELGRTLRLRIQVSGYDAVCLMVEAALGVGILPRAVAKPYIESQRVCGVSLNEAWARRELLICVRSFEALPVAAKLLVQHLRLGERAA
jgi:DNA-binding transcriptional LysR family regulator